MVSRLQTASYGVLDELSENMSNMHVWTVSGTHNSILKCERTRHTIIQEAASFAHNERLHASTRKTVNLFLSSLSVSYHVMKYYAKLSRFCTQACHAKRVFVSNERRAHCGGISAITMNTKKPKAPDTPTMPVMKCFNIESMRR